VPKSVSRRRFFQIIAAASATGLVGAVRAATPGGGIRIWEGEALGADASITLAGLEPECTDALLEACLKEIGRQEGIFTLYEPSSDLSRLNAEGTLSRPPRELIDLLEICRGLFELSERAFDPTIQPLWRLYAETYGDLLSPRAPEPSEIASRRRLIGFGDVTWDSERVRFARPGMAITLNGIAQGAITDRVTSLLRGGGATHALVNVGEYSGVSSHPSGRPWQVGIQDPSTADAIAGIMGLTDQAVATPGAYGGRFGDSGFSHIIDPRTGESPRRYLSVSVRHASATLADGLSTAFSFMTESAIAATAERVGGVSVLLIRTDGTLVRI